MVELSLPRLQNLNQTSTFWLNLKFNVLTKPSFRILTKVKPHNFNQAPASIYWPDLSFTILPGFQLWVIDQTLCSKSEQKFNFMTKLQLPHLHQIVVNMSFSINITNSNNLNKFWVGIFTRQGHINQVYFTQVSQLVTRKADDQTRVWQDPTSLSTVWELHSIPRSITFFLTIRDSSLNSTK